MIIQELALIGIRNFVQLTRLTLKPGLNIILGGNGSGKSTLREALISLLSPISDSTAWRWKPRDPGSQSQIGLLFKTENSRVYRLIRDWVNRKISLAEMGAANKFQVILSEEEPILKFIADQTGGLETKALEGLFVLKQSDMPSSRKSAVSAIESLPVAQSADPRKSPLSIDAPAPAAREQKKQRLQELKGMLEIGDKLAAMEDQLANTQSKLAEVNHRLRSAVKKDDELKNWDEQGRQFDSMKNLPEGFHLTLETGEQQEQAKNEQLAAIEEQAAEARQELEEFPASPFFKSRFFLGGAGTVVLAMILLSSILMEGILLNVVMFSVLGGIGSAAYAGLLDYTRGRKRAGLERRLRDSDRQKTRIEITYKKENAQCVEILKKAGCPDIPSLKEKYRDYEQYLQNRRPIESERDQLLGSRTFDDLRGESERLTQEIREIEARIKASNTLSSDIYLIQEELRTLERDLSESPNPNRMPGLPGADAMQKDPDPLFSGGSSNGPAEIVASGLKWSLHSPSVHEALSSRRDDLKGLCARLMAGIGGPAETEMNLDDELTPSLSTPRSPSLSWDQISAGHQDLCYLVYQLAISKLLSVTHPFPLLLDNPLVTLDPAHQQAALDILREIAQNRQVLLLTTSAPHREGDHLIHLK